MIRKDSESLISILRNNDSEDGEEDKTAKSSSRQINNPNRKESKVATALRNFGQLGTNIEEIRRPQLPGQQDTRPYSFENNVVGSNYILISSTEFPW